MQERESDERMPFQIFLVGSRLGYELKLASGFAGDGFSFLVLQILFFEVVDQPCRTNFWKDLPLSFP